MINYKFWYVARDDYGFITEVAIRIFQGEINTKKEINAVTKEEKDVTRFRIFKRLEKRELKHIKKSFKKENNGNDAIIFTDKDFGRIKTDEELTNYCNKIIWQL